MKPELSIEPHSRSSIHSYVGPGHDSNIPITLHLYGRRTPTEGAITHYQPRNGSHWFEIGYYDAKGTYVPQPGRYPDLAQAHKALNEVLSIQDAPNAYLVTGDSLAEVVNQLAEQVAEQAKDKERDMADRIELTKVWLTLVEAAEKIHF